MVKLVRRGIMGEFLCLYVPSWYGVCDRGDISHFNVVHYTYLWAR